MVELEYWKTKAKLFELQGGILHLQKQIGDLISEKSQIFLKLGLDPNRNYTFNDERLELIDANTSLTSDGSDRSAGNP